MTAPALLAVAAAAGYLVGSVSPAALLARRRGIDLHEAGSGNPGATNAGRVLGRRTGVAVAALDVVKGVAPAVGFGLAAPAAGLMAGFAAVLGHVTSPFLRGRGGKGAATALGAVVGSQPRLGLVAVVVWVVVVAASRWVALASMSAALSVPAAAAVFGVRRRTLLWAVAIAAIVVVRHRPNIERAWRTRH